MNDQIEKVLNEPLTDAEIMRALGYLHSDLCPERAGKDIGRLVAICITLLIELGAATAFMCLYLRCL